MVRLVETFVVFLVSILIVSEVLIPLFLGKPVFPMFRKKVKPVESTPKSEKDITDKLKEAKEKVEEVKVVQKEVEEIVKKTQEIKKESDNLLK